MSTMEAYTLITCFAVIGGGLKYIDDAFDEGVFDRKRAVLLAGLVTILWIGVSIHDPVSATILFAVLLGVLLAGKIDNLVFRTSSASIILVLVCSGRFEPLSWTFAALVLAGVLDEKGNDLVVSHHVSRFMEFFLRHRFSMKVGVLAVCAASLMPWVYLLAFLSFDLAYDTVGFISMGFLTKTRDGTPPVHPLRTWPVIVAC